MVNSLTSYIDKTIKWLLKSELGRFLVGGGVNTLMGGILIPFVMKEGLGLTNFTFLTLTLDLPLTIGYLIWFSFAYLINIKFVFKSRFEVRRYLLYPLTQIPNYIINQIFVYIFLTLLALPSIIAYGLSAVLAVPIMFVIVRVIVKTKPKDTSSK
jgi:putative flippase GtrA